MERDPQRACGSFVEGTNLLRMARAAFAILAQLRELRLDLSPSTVERELVRHVRIVQAQLTRHDALGGPLTALAEPDVQAAFGCDGHGCTRRRSAAIRRR
jgi:hypothetical protein